MTEPQNDISDERIPKKEKSSGTGNDKEKQKTKRKRDDGKETAEEDCIIHGENCGHASHNCRTLKHLAKKTKDSWGKEKPKKKEELHTMLAGSFATAIKNMTKKKKESSQPKVQFDLNMLDGLSMSDDEKFNAKLEDGENRDKDDSSDLSWKIGQSKAESSNRSRISNKKSRKLKNYFKKLFSATLSNVSNKTKLKSKTYASQQAKLTDRLKTNKNKD